MLAIAGCSEDNTHPKVSPVDEPSADAVTILATIDAIPSATGDGEAYAPLWQEGDQIVVGYKGISYVYETYDAGNGVEFHPMALSLPADARGEVTAYARLFLNGNWAQDVVQDVFVNVWVRREALDPGQSLYGYLLRSVYNQSVNYVNKHRHACSYRSYYQERIESIGYAYYDPDRNPVIEKLYSQDLRTSINEAIAALPAKCREVFSLSYLQGFSHREISERMGIAQSTVENHIYLALRQLRAKLSKSELILLLFFIFLQNNSHPLG